MAVGRTSNVKPDKLFRRLDVSFKKGKNNELVVEKV